MATKQTQLVMIDLSEVSPSFQWYAIATIFNNEESYARHLNEIMNKYPEIGKLIDEVYIPIKYIKETKKTKDGEKTKIHKQKGAYSGYVFVRCIMNPRLWEILRTTTGASVVLTSGSSPAITPEEDIKKIKETQKPVGFSRKELREIARGNAKFC